MDIFDFKKRSQIMSHIHGRGNVRTELVLIALFYEMKITGWRRGQYLYFQIANKKCRITPDFVFRDKKIAVFVDGEFWHGQPTRANIPKSNRAFWIKKIEGNKARDRRQNRVLRQNGWTVVRIWQFELKTKAFLRKLAKAGLSPSIH
jgi:DNA mismatch endonuclease, patch repair protein